MLSRRRKTVIWLVGKSPVNPAFLALFCGCGTVELKWQPYLTSWILNQKGRKSRELVAASTLNLLCTLRFRSSIKTDNWLTGNSKLCFFWLPLTQDKIALDGRTNGRYHVRSKFDNTMTFPMSTSNTRGETTVIVRTVWDIWMTLNMRLDLSIGRVAWGSPAVKENIWVSW